VEHRTWIRVTLVHVKGEATPEAAALQVLFGDVGIGLSRDDTNGCYILVLRSLRGQLGMRMRAGHYHLVRRMTARLERGQAAEIADGEML
jgi:hypothetical protein